MYIKIKLKLIIKKICFINYKQIYLRIKIHIVSFKIKILFLFHSIIYLCITLTLQ